MNNRYYILFTIVVICSSFGIIKYYELEYPDYFPQPAYNFKNNPLSEEAIELGRVLFYDPILSRDNTISCASCHSPYNSFAHSDHDLSHGIDDQIGNRNAPALFNLAWQSTFMWDGAINNLDMQALAPISHPMEMDESIQNIVLKLQQKEIYPGLFKEAFGDTLITGEYVLKALSQFQLTLISANSKYDHISKGEDKFNEQESRGYDLFKRNCNSCHTEPLFSNYSFANNGLIVDTTLNDFGKYVITRQSKDSLLFKVPSLRNLKFTSPYMHDGRFKKLNEVLNHYISGIIKTETLDSLLGDPIELSSNDKADVLAFLLTLNDTDFVFNPKHQFRINKPVIPKE
jgi:cytochrome c peroxidase